MLKASLVARAMWGASPGAPLPARKLAFGNVECVIDNRAAAWTSDQVGESLKRTEQQAMSSGKSAIWLQFSPLACAHIACAISNGFDLHHTEEQTVYMVKWIKDDGPSKVPPHGVTQIGVAGICINDDREILVIKEKGSIGTKWQHWKFPGGLSDRGEELGDAAEREVFEETGVRAKFEAIIGMRHSHGLKWGQSDLYVGCKLRPLTREIVPQEEEIQEARWMDVDEFLKQARHPMLKVFLAGALKPNGGMTASEMTFTAMNLNRPPFLVYHPPYAGLPELLQKG